MNSVVLWYDIGRQGATNESMSLSPILKDLSGNGNDATCYNFGWTEESGISTTNYPNALVSDGVDDYAFVQDKYDDEGNLINKKSLVLNREDGYTVIAKRKNLYQLNENGIVASKHSGSNYGAFQIEYNFDNINAKACSFGTFNSIQISSSEIIYQTSKSYNGEKSLNIGTRNDTRILDLFKYINLYFGKVALYSFILFNRDLTDEEIEWVKNNLIQ